MNEPRIVSHDDWIAARKELLAQEKELTRQRDRLSRRIRDLPWERVEKDYVFDGPDGRETLAELFAGSGQLIVYHFMFDPGWDEGCMICSFMADHFAPLVVHLRQRDVTMVAVSRAPLTKLEAFRQRMGWDFRWVSSASNDFSRDFRVSFTQEQIDRGEVEYNYRRESGHPATELPGMSVFATNTAGEVFHTYSTYARGLETFLGTYRFLDVVPRGRDEDGLAFTMQWIRHRDRY